MSEPIVIDVTERGLSFVYDDAAVALLDCGTATVRRASHVEPAPGGGWMVDMSPIAPVRFGPYRLRSEALKVERAWLLRHAL